MNRRERRAAEKAQRKAFGSLRETARNMELGKERSGAVVPPSPCGHCGKVLDGASTDSGVRPEPGNIAVCIGCAGVNQFGPDLRLLPLAEADIEAFGPEPVAAIRAHQAVIRQLIERMRTN